MLFNFEHQELRIESCRKLGVNINTKIRKIFFIKIAICLCNKITILFF